MKHNMRVGISPLTWTNDDMPSLGGRTPFEKCIREMRATKFQGTEFGSKFPKDPRVLKPKLQQQELQLVASWFSSYLTDYKQREVTFQRFEQLLKFLSKMGASVANICECTNAVHQTSAPLFGAKPQMSQKDWELLASGLERLGKQALRYDIAVAYHHHMGTLIQNEREIHKVMEMTDPALVHLLVDTGHARLAGVNLEEIMRRHGSRIRHVHLKDVRSRVALAARRGNWSFLDAVRAGIFTVPGDGNIQYGSVISKLRSQKYDRWIMIEAEQDPQQAHPLRFARLARANIEALLEKSL